MRARDAHPPDSILIQASMALPNFQRSESTFRRRAQVSSTISVYFFGRAPCLHLLGKRCRSPNIVCFLLLSNLFDVCFPKLRAAPSGFLLRCVELFFGPGFRQRKRKTENQNPHKQTTYTSTQNGQVWEKTPKKSMSIYRCKRSFKNTTFYCTVKGRIFEQPFTPVNWHVFFSRFSHL